MTLSAGQMRRGRPAMAGAGRGMLRAAVLLAMIGSLTAVTACGRLGSGRKTQQEAGLPFRTSLSKGADPRDITVTVQAPGATLDAVRESVRFEATRYCLLNRGSSAADWTMDAASGDWAYQVAGENLVFTARCRA